mgnify:CR=1 FL=1
MAFKGVLHTFELLLLEDGLELVEELHGEVLLADIVSDLDHVVADVPSVVDGVEGSVSDVSLLDSGVGGDDVFVLVVANFVVLAKKEC